MTASWHTPALVVDAARAALGGVVDVDPASSPEANATVQARRFYTEADSGLAPGADWSGTCWLNPPYEPSPLLHAFLRRLDGELLVATTAAVALVPVGTLASRAGQDLLRRAVDVTIVAGRLSWGGDGAGAGPGGRGWALLGLGDVDMTACAHLGVQLAPAAVQHERPRRLCGLPGCGRPAADRAGSSWCSDVHGARGRRRRARDVRADQQ